MIDYAAQCHSALGRWLDRLAYQKLETKLRILLLDREAPENFGWWHELTSASLRDQAVRLELFFAPRPRQLPDLADLEERRDLMTAAFEAAVALRPPPTALPGVPAAGADADFDARLADHQFGNPLNLVMAGVIARDRGPRAALALRRLDAAREVGGRELKRLAKLAESRGLKGDTMSYIVAFNGLAGGLPFEGLRKTLADELAASQRSADLDALLPLLEQELPSRAETKTPVRQPRLATIQPDLIGEAAIIEAFTGSRTTEAEAVNAVRRAYTLGPEMAAQALVRLVQDFGYAAEDKSATEDEKKTGERVMDWLVILGLEIENPVQLIPLVEALPLETTVLREAAAGLTDRLATFFRQEAGGNYDPNATFDTAIWVNNLSVRLSILGRREDAVAAGEEAVRLHRALAGTRLDAFTPYLAASLNNLANRLSALGRREEALTSSEESVRLRRPLAEARPDAFTPGLALSLNNLANKLSDLGRREEALAAAEETVLLQRALAAGRPDAFTPGLALSLNNLANGLSDLGRREDTLAAADEAVRLYRGLAEARPDAFTSDLAASLTNFANALSEIGLCEDALAAAEEPVRLYRPLAEARPDAFTPDLAASLNNLATVLSDLGRREEALAAAEDALRLYRALAGARPNAFTPNLTVSLNNLAAMLNDLGRREEALTSSEEAVRHYRALAEARPDAFTLELAQSLWVVGDLHKESNTELALSTLAEGIERLSPLYAAVPAAVSGVMAGLVQSYVSHCEAIGQEPDGALLAPVLEVFERLKTQGGQS